MENKKQVVSIRLSNYDLVKVKEIARQVRARESEIYRFAIKSMLTRLAPLHDGSLCGKELLPMVIEICSELTNSFDIDLKILDEMINKGVEHPHQRVEKDDLQLLMMLGMPEQYIYLKLKNLVKHPLEPIGMSSAVRQYLFEKYGNTRVVRKGCEVVPI